MAFQVLNVDQFAMPGQLGGPGVSALQLKKFAEYPSAGSKSSQGKSQGKTQRSQESQEEQDSKTNSKSAKKQKTSHNNGRTQSSSKLASQKLANYNGMHQTMPFAGMAFPFPGMPFGPLPGMPFQAPGPFAPNLNLETMLSPHQQQLQKTDAKTQRPAQPARKPEFGNFPEDSDDANEPKDKIKMSVSMEFWIPVPEIYQTETQFLTQDPSLKHTLRWLQQMPCGFTMPLAGTGVSPSQYPDVCGSPNTNSEPKEPKFEGIINLTNEQIIDAAKYNLYPNQKLSEINGPLQYYFSNPTYFSTVVRENYLKSQYGIEPKKSKDNENSPEKVKPDYVPNKTNLEHPEILNDNPIMLVVNEEGQKTMMDKRVAVYSVEFDAIFDYKSPYYYNEKKGLYNYDNVGHALEIRNNGLFQSHFNAVFTNFLRRRENPIILAHAKISELEYVSSSLTGSLTGAVHVDSNGGLVAVSNSNKPTFPTTGGHETRSLLFGTPQMHTADNNTCIFHHPGFSSKTEFEKFIENKSGPGKAFAPSLSDEFLNPNSFTCGQKFELLKKDAKKGALKSDEELCNSQLQYGYEVHMKLTDGSIYKDGAYFSWNTPEFPTWDDKLKEAYPFPYNAGLNVKILGVHCKYTPPMLLEGTQEEAEGASGTCDTTWPSTRWYGSVEVRGPSSKWKKGCDVNGVTY